MARGSRREFKTLSNTYPSIWYETLDGWIAGSEFLESKRTGVFDCVIVKSLLQKLQQHHTHSKALVAKCILGIEIKHYIYSVIEAYLAIIPQNKFRSETIFHFRRHLCVFDIARIASLS